MDSKSFAHHLLHLPGVYLLPTFAHAISQARNSLSPSIRENNIYSSRSMSNPFSFSSATVPRVVLFPLNSYYCLFYPVSTREVRPQTVLSLSPSAFLLRGAECIFHFSVYLTGHSPWMACNWRLTNGTLFILPLHKSSLSPSFTLFLLFLTIDSKVGRAGKSIL